MLRVLRHRAFASNGIGAGLQLRIGTDWDVHVRTTLRPTIGEDEDYAPGFERILEKTAATLVDARRSIYVVCDERYLPVAKDRIRDLARTRFGLHLFWKSDLLPPSSLATLPALTQSLLDFEMAVSAPVFVGLSRSSFSNLAAFERFSRTRQPVTTHYIYDSRSPALSQRRDNGAGRSAREARAS